MSRAKKLTSGLGGEREMWLKETKKLEESIENLLGDQLLSVGFISYLGAFPGNYRIRIINEMWIQKVKKLNKIIIKLLFKNKNRY